MSSFFPSSPSSPHNMPRQNQNHHDHDRQSKSGRTDNDKRQGGGAYSWGKATDGGESQPAPVSKGEGGAFLDRLETKAKTGYFKATNVTDQLFYIGVTAGLRANQQELVCGVWAANTVGDSLALDATNATKDFTSFKNDLDGTDCRGNNYANVDGFIATHAIDLDHHAACIFIGSESKDVPLTLLREGALATGCSVIDVGVMTKDQLEHVIASYNKQPFTTKSDFDNAVAATPVAAVALPSVTTTSAVAEAAVSSPKGETKTKTTPTPTPTTTMAPPKSTGPTLEQLLNVDERYKIYNDDTCFGQDAPSLASLDIMHWPEGTEPVEEIKYSDHKATVVCFWAKTHKGNYPTICTWSDMAELDRFKDCVQFVGVARDAAQANLESYKKKIGKFNETLGRNGITISGGIPLAYDVTMLVNTGFRETTTLKVLGVDNCFIVNTEGKIMWRALFNRGDEPSGLFMKQLEHVVKGEDVELIHEAPVVVEDNTPDEDVDADKAAGLKSLMCDDY